MKRMVLIPEEKLLYYERRENDESKVESGDSNNGYESLLNEQSRFVDTKDNELSDDVIIRGIPKTMKTRAMALLERLKARPDAVSWDSMGQVELNGNLIPKSNISDLISDAMRPRKYFDPEGSRQFFCVLKEINVPRDLVRNEERWKEAEDVPCRKVSLSQEREDYTEQQVGGIWWDGKPRTGKGWVVY